MATLDYKTTLKAIHKAFRDQRKKLGLKPQVRCPAAKRLGEAKATL